MIKENNKKIFTRHQAVTKFLVVFLIGSFLFGDNVLAANDYTKATAVTPVSTNWNNSISNYDKPINASLSAPEWNGLFYDFVNTWATSSMAGPLGIGTTASASYILDANGTIRATNFSGALSGTVSAPNVSSGIFGANTGNGNFSFPGNLSVNTASSLVKFTVNQGSYGWPATTSTAQTYGALRLQAETGGNVTLDMGVNGSNGTWLQTTNRSDLSLSYPLILNPNGGNVGIGTNNPGVYKLSVNGPGLFSSYLNVSNAAYAQSFQPTGITANWIAQLRSDAYNFVFKNASSTDLVTVTGTGSVGIGTASPYSKLQINSANFLDNDHALTFGSASGLTYYYGIGGAGSTGNEGVGIWGGTETAVKSATNTHLFVKRSSGNVGIGTTTPSQKLDVQGNIRANGIVQSVQVGGSNFMFSMDSTNGAGPRLQLGTVSSPATYFELGAWGSINNFDSKTRDLALFNSGVTVYLKNSTGNVGIGTTTPASKLTISAGDLELDHNKSIKVSSATTNTTLLLGNYADGQAFAYGTSSPNKSASLAVEGDVKADRLCIEEDCKAAWSEIVTAGGGNQWVTSGNNIYNSNSGGVAIGTTTPGVYKLYVNGNANINGTITATNFTGSYGGTIAAPNVSSGSFADNTGGGNFSFPGNLGIGTTTLGARLTVSGGDILLDNNRYISWMNNVGAKRDVMRLDSANKLSLSNPTGNLIDLGGSMYIENAGSVGIGTSAPGSNLDVNGTDQSAAIRVSMSGIPTVYSALTSNSLTMNRNTGSTVNLNIKTTLNSGTWGAGGGDILFSPNNSELVRLTAGGSVGIGTANPGTYKLNVNGDTNITGTLNVSGAITASGITGITVAAPNVSAGTFADNTGGGNFSFTGNVGIGTTTPSSNLHVVGTSYLNGTLNVTGNTTFSGNTHNFYQVNSPYSTLSVGRGATQRFAMTVDDMTGTMTSYQQDELTGDHSWIFNIVSPTTGLQNYYFRNNGSNLLTLTKNGNIGVGTTTPLNKLQVGSSIYSGNDFSVGNSNGSLAINNNVGSTYIYASQRLDLLSAGTGITISGGNVSIGTTTPVSKLTMFGANPRLSITHNVLNAGDTGIDFILNPLMTAERKNAIVVSATGSYGKGDMSFVLDSANDSANYTVGADTKMIIKNSGSVGIGTTTPGSYKLFVNGDTNINGNLNVSGTITADGITGITVAAPNVSSGEFGANTAGGNYIFGATVSGNVGIGTLTPVSRLSIVSADNKDSGPIVLLAGNAANQTEGGRIRFNEFANGSNYQGAFVHYNALSNIFNIGVHEAADLATSSDVNVISILRSNGYIGIGTTNPAQKFQISGGSGYVNGGNLYIDNNYGFISSDGKNGVYPNTASGVIFKASSTEYMRIGLDGNVGIGTTNPITKLDIAGDVNLNNQAVTTAGSLNRGYYVYRSGTTAYGLKLQYTGGEYGPMIFGPNQANRFISFGKVGAALEDDDMVEQMRLDLDTGNLGIGTTVANSKLTIAGGDLELDHNKSVKVSSSTSNTTLLFGNYADSLGFYYGTSTQATNKTVSLAVEGDVKADRLCIEEDCKSAWSEIVTAGGGNQWITSGNNIYNSNTGNVGIGTTTPEAKFSISNPNAYQLSSLATSINSANAFRIRGRNTAVATLVVSSLDTLNYGIQAVNDAGNTGTNIAINPFGGNVGIGTTTPVSALQVNGTITASAFSGPLSGTVTAPNVSSGAFAANTGGGNFTFPGYVGIGTTNPIRKIDVQSTGSDVVAQFVATGTNASVLVDVRSTGTTPKDAAIRLQGSNNWTFGVDGTNNNFGVYYGNNYPSSIADNYKYLAINNTGNVGIGTSNPGAKLELFNSGDTVFKISGNTDNAWLSRFSNRLHIASNDMIQFGTGGQTDVDVTIDSVGKVGVGTAAPDNLLDVSASSSGGIGGIAQITNPATTASGNAVELRFAPSDAHNIRYSSIQGINNGSNGIDLAFITGAGATITEKMRINSSGNVAIGTTTPGSYKLFVDGDTNINGNLNVSGTITADGITGITVAAPNVSSGAFAANTGGGNFTFPANVAIGTTNASTYGLNVNGSIYGSTIYAGSASNYITTQNGYLSLMSAGNEMRLGGAATMYINYGSATGTTTTNYIWNAGTSTSYATHTMGNVFSTGGFSTYDTTVTDNYIEAGGLCLGNGTNCITSWTNVGGSLNASSPTANYVPKFSDADTLANSLIYDNGSTVSVGTTTASAYKVNIIGNTNVAGTLSATTFSGAYAGTIAAPNVSSGTFAANTGNGNFNFPGNLNVGTTTPASHRLYVNGTTYLNGATTINGIATVNSGLELSTGGTRSVSYYGPVANNYFTRMETTATAGFGTYGQVTSDWALYNRFTGANTRGWIWQLGTTNVAALNGQGHLQIAGNLNSQGTGNNYFAGNVGIGTTDPLAKLQIGTWGIVDGGIDGSVGTLFGSNVYYSSGYRAIYNGNAIFSSYGNNGIDLYAQSVAPGLFTPVSRLHVSMDGNVGIGTTTPGSYKLYVNGNTNINGTITATTFSGALSGTVAAPNVSSGTLAGNTGGGNFNLLGNFGIGTTTTDKKLVVQLSDAAGVDEFKVIDSAGVNAFNVDSDGNVLFGAYPATVNFNNSNVTGMNNVAISDGGPSEGMTWADSAWSIDTSPLDRSNATGNLNLYGTANNIALWRPTLLTYNATNYTTLTPQSTGGLNITTTGTGNVTFNPGGGVAIGTSTPGTSKLYVNGDTHVNGTLSATSFSGNLSGSVSSSNVSSGAFGSNVGGGDYSFPGNLGIGTTNPEAQLTLRGSDTVLNFGDDNSNKGLLQWNSAGNYIRLQTIIGGGYSGNIALQPNGGNVGIGTTSPVANLHISGINNQSIKIESTNSSGDNDIRFTRTGLETWTLGRDNTANDFKLSYVANNTGGLGTGDLLTVKSTGNVGIGTTTPASKLTITGGDLELDHNKSVKVSSSTSNTTLLFGNYADSLGFYYGTSTQATNKTVSLAVEGDVKADRLCIEEDCKAAWSEIVAAGGGNQWVTSGNNIYNSNSANVGIGTNNPGAKLDVNGDIRIQNGIGTHIASFVRQDAVQNASLSISAYGGIGFTGGKTVGSETTNYQMFLNNTGNVGIGTTTPGAYKLYVNGNTNVNGTLSATTFSGSLSGTVGAANVSAGSFAANTGGGNFTFPANVDMSTLSISGKTVLTLPSNNPEVGPWNPIWNAIGSSKPLYFDEEFASGNNNVSVYNNAGGSAVTLTRLTGQTGVPNSTGVVLRISYDGVGSVNPGFGGFIQSWNAVANRTYVQRFRAKIPVGRNLVLAENPQGTNNTSYWLTNTAGTGKWEDYVRVSHAGNTGTFSSGGHVYISGGSGAFDWYLSSVNVYEVNTPIISSPNTWASAQTFGGGAYFPGSGIWNTSGNVGIGTSTPGTYKLSVVGDTNISGSLNITGTISGATLAGTLNASNISAGTFASNTGGGNFNLVGNFGLGTTTTAKHKLDVVGNAAIGLAASSYSDEGNNLHIWASDVPVVGYTGSNILIEENDAEQAFSFLGANNAVQKIVFGRASNNSIGQISFDHNTSKYGIIGGNVGIGITNPIYNLHTIGSVAADTLHLASRSDGYYGVELRAIDNGVDGHTLGIFTRQGPTAGYNQSITLLNTGNLGIATTTPTEAKLVISAGTGMALKAYGDGVFTGTLQTQTGSDFAEEFITNGDLDSGTVVVMGDKGYKSVKPSYKSYDKTVVGIVSNNPSIIAGKVDSKHKAIIAMMGVVKVKVTDINGKIYRGDMLTTSNVAGHAMKADDSKSGTIIGKALETLTKKSGEINVLVNLQ